MTLAATEVCWTVFYIQQQNFEVKRGVFFDKTQIKF